MAKVSSLPPHWLDAIIEKELNKRGGGSAASIATAICSSKKFMDAIRRGLKQKPEPGKMAPSYAQEIRQEVVEAVESAR